MFVLIHFTIDKIYFFIRIYLVGSYFHNTCIRICA